MAIRPTTRGLSLLLSAAIFLAAGIALGEIGFVTLGLFLFLLPALALAAVAVTPRLSYSQTPATLHSSIDQSITCRLQIESRLPSPFFTPLVIDQQIFPLEGSTRFSPIGWGRIRHETEFQISAHRRGRFRLSTPTVRVQDPLGLARYDASASGDSPVLRIAPKIWPLPAVSAGGTHGENGDTNTNRSGFAGDPDVLVRQHRQGDGMRKVHWRLSAKRDELMVRLDDEPLEPAAFLLADTRRCAHGELGRASSLEWALSAAASVAMRMLNEHYRFVLSCETGEIFNTNRLRGIPDAAALLDALIDVMPSQKLSLSSAVPTPNLRTRLVVFAGAISSADAQSLVALGNKLTQPAILVPKLSAWGLERADQGFALDLLHRSGWASYRYSPSDTVPSAWSALNTRQVIS